MCFWTIACSAPNDPVPNDPVPNDPDPNELNDALGAEPNDGPENDWGDPSNDWLDPELANEAPPLKIGAEAEMKIWIN